MINRINLKHLSKGKTSFLVLILSLLVSTCFAQGYAGSSREEKRYIKKADKQWRKAHLGKALDLYKKAIAVNPRNSYTNFQAGAIYFVSDSFKVKALPYFQNTIKYSPAGIDDTIIDAYYYMAYCYMLKEKYDSSATCFRQYESHLDNAKINKEAFKEMDRNLAICKMAPGILKRTPDSTAFLISGKPQPVYIKNVNNSLNTQFPEYSQIVYDNDSSMLFTSRRPTSQKGKIDDITGRFFEDTYVSKKDTNGYWSPPALFAQQLNISPKKLNMATVSLSDDGNTLFIYHDGDILQSGKNGSGWSNPQSLSKNIKKLKKYFIPSVFISEDGTRLLLVSDAKGGYGGRDIYMCSKDLNGNWSDPQNLGPAINTSEDEDSPYLMPDNKTLFFSSKGHGGLGGYDIFVSRLDNNGNWSTPQNLGAPINSPADDIYFTYNSDVKKGYFSSSRISGFGDMDIYSYSFTCDDIENTNLKGKILADAQGNAIPSVTMQITDLSSKRKSAPVTVSVDANGKYEEKLKPNHKYHLEIISAGYTPYDMNFTAPHQCDAYNLYQTIKLSKVDDNNLRHVGQNLLVKNAFYRSAVYASNKNARKDSDIGPMIAATSDTGAIYEKDTAYTMTYTPEEVSTINHVTNAGTNGVSGTNGSSLPVSVIYFHWERYDLDTSYFPFLNSVAAILKVNKNMNLRINGYTDNIGKDDYNAKLSLMRANSVAKYLYHQGIKRSRIRYKGMGATQFVAPNDGEHNHMNRRVEVLFIK